MSNAFGITPVTVGAAHIALRDKEATIVAASGRRLTFSGRPTMAIPAGAVLFSVFGRAVVAGNGRSRHRLYLPGNTNTPSPLTVFCIGSTDQLCLGDREPCGSVAVSGCGDNADSFLLARVEVMAPQAVGAIVAYGDSITAGSRSTVDTNNRYPNHLARRLQASPTPMGVLDAGIGGNRVLSEGAFTAGMNAVGRFDRDVMMQTGVTHVIVLEGINDIGNARENPTPTAEDLIAGHKQLIERAHTRGIKIFGATLTPFEGAAYYSRWGSKAAGGQPMDSHQRCLRRRD